MSEREPAKSATTDGLTLSPSLDLVTEAAQVPPHYSLIDQRVLLVCGFSMVLGMTAAVVAQLLIGLIALVTNLAYFGEFSVLARPGGGHPPVGGLVDPDSRDRRHRDRLDGPLRLEGDPRPRDPGGDGASPHQ